MGERDHNCFIRNNNRIQKTSKLFMLIIIQLLLCFSLIAFLQGSAFVNEEDKVFRINNFTENGRVHKEKYIEWPNSASVGTITLLVGSIIHFNCTVLTTSNSSVEFEFMHELGLENQTFYNPDPIDFILAPGESYTETFTIVNGTAEFHSELSYKAYLLQEGGNATIHWWYEVLKYGKMSLPGFIFSFGSLSLLSVIILVSKKRKST
jgi:hypothetical protein